MRIAVFQVEFSLKLFKTNLYLSKPALVWCVLSVCAFNIYLYRVGQ